MMPEPFSFRIVRLRNPFFREPLDRRPAWRQRRERDLKNAYPSVHWLPR